MIVEACLYNIQIIGEAVSKLSEEVKKDNPDIPWILIKGMRNRLIHDYIGTDLQLVWNIIINELPSFSQRLNKFMTHCLRKRNKTEYYKRLAYCFLIIWYSHLLSRKVI